jgi:hypothetical protein
VALFFGDAIRPFHQRGGSISPFAALCGLILDCAETTHRFASHGFQYPSPGSPIYEVGDGTRAISVFFFAAQWRGDCWRDICSQTSLEENGKDQFV